MTMRLLLKAMDTVQFVRRSVKPGNDWISQSANVDSILTDKGLLSGVRTESRFDVDFFKLQPISSIRVTGPAWRVTLVGVSSMMDFRFDNTGVWTMPRFESGCLWNGIKVYFQSTPTESVFKIELTHMDEVKLSPLHKCFRDAEEDMTFKCSDGVVLINSNLAKATSKFVKGSQSFDLNSVDLSQFDVTTVTAVKSIMIERTVKLADLSPKVEELMHYLLVRGRKKVWPLVRQTLSLKNVLDYLWLAEQFEDAETRENAQNLISQNFNRFVVRDTMAFCQALSLKD